MSENKIQLIDQIDECYDALFLRIARVQIERTKTNKQLTTLEQQYIPKFNKIFTKIVTEYADKRYLLFEAEKKYGGQIRILIRSLVTQTYFIGMEYVARATNKPELVYLTDSDYRSIMTQSDEAYRMFWRLTNKYLQVLRNKSLRTAEIIDNNVTTTDEIQNSSDESDYALLDAITNIKLIINAIVTPLLAFSTIQKFRQISEDERQQLLLSKGIDPSLNVNSAQLQNAKFVYATEKDSAVCKICAPLEGMTWSINDSSIVIPRVNSHPNCRCRILLQINGKIISK